MQMNEQISKVSDMKIKGVQGCSLVALFGPALAVIVRSTELGGY